MRREIQELWNLAEPPIRGAGLDLIELEWTRDGSGWVLRVYIDGPHGVSFNECERVSRDVSATLDVADVIKHAYRLEVSSPGIDRPLRRPEDFGRFAGQKVKIRTMDAVEERRNFSGTIRSVRLESDAASVEVDCDGRVYRIPVDTIARANLVPNWEAEFRKKESVSA